nr:MAG TPA: hypothetical protein [Caudoviricetes sp.]
MGFASFGAAGAAGRPGAGYLVLQGFLEIVKDFVHFRLALFLVRLCGDFLQRVEDETDEGLELAVCLAHCGTPFPLG